MPTYVFPPPLPEQYEFCKYCNKRFRKKRRKHMFCCNKHRSLYFNMQKALAEQDETQSLRKEETK